MDICHILEQLRSSSDSRYEKMKCAQATYERLPDVQLELAALELDTKEEEELLFHNDDGSVVSVVVERNLCAADLCQLLALKNRVGKDVSWTLVEHWDRLGLERSLEDHEEVLTVYRESQCRFIFRKDFRKYEFFHSPTQFFPPDMVDLDVGLDQPQAVQSLLAGECPPVFSQVWIREANKNVWCKAFLLLRDRNLYISHKVQIVAKFLRTWKCSNKVGAAGEEPVLWARLSDYTVYTTLNARNQFRAPTEFGLCLRGSGSGGGTELRCLACETERARVCWLTAMRLAKYGKQLRDNYRSFKSKTISHLSPTKPLDVVRSNRNAKPNEYSSLTVPNESVRSRVAMDFTGSVGRIVDDPQEARAIAVAEGYSWKRRWRPTVRGSTPSLFHHSGLEAGIHTTQPWFHSGMSRDQASQLVNTYGTVDGVFLVRESRSSPGSFVLTYKCGGKVLHSQIQPVMDPVKESVCYSLDSGVTKFYDLLQLVEFYQLNAGCLPTRLTHYIVQSPTGPLYAEKRTIPASF